MACAGGHTSALGLDSFRHVFSLAPFTSALKCSVFSGDAMHEPRIPRRQTAAGLTQSQFDSECQLHYLPELSLHHDSSVSSLHFVPSAPLLAETLLGDTSSGSFALWQVSSSSSSSSSLSSSLSSSSSSSASPVYQFQLRQGSCWASALHPDFINSGQVLLGCTKQALLLSLSASPTSGLCSPSSSTSFSSTNSASTVSVSASTRALHSQQQLSRHVTAFPTSKSDVFAVEFAGFDSLSNFFTGARDGFIRTCDPRQPRLGSSASTFQSQSDMKMSSSVCFLQSLSFYSPFYLLAAAVNGEVKRFGFCCCLHAVMLFFYVLSPCMLLHGFSDSFVGSANECFLFGI